MRPTQQLRLWLAAALALLVGALVSCSSGRSEQPADSTSPGPFAVRVSGSQLVDGSGSTVVLRGVNRSGTEYACIDGWGVFDGPADQASIDAMKAWGVNAVRVPLNSACWLDLKDQFVNYNPAYAGKAYRDAVEDYVGLLAANGIYAILDLQWTGCGEAKCPANSLKPMPDRAYATKFWESVAGRFRKNRSVLFDLFNEPHGVDWSCWQTGGCTVLAGDHKYTAEGMQQMVDAVRATGAETQPILLGGLQYSNDMTGWSSHLPTDPSDSLVASIHLYNSNYPCPGSAGTATAAIDCFTSRDQNSLQDLAKEHPVVFGELGQDRCGTDFVGPMLNWIGEQGYSVLGWAWNTADCASFPALITDYDGTPTAFGRAFKDFYSRAGTAARTTTSNRIISRDRPAFASAGEASAGNDADYSKAWQVPAGETGWLAYDLSGVSEEHRGKVVVAWSTVLDDGFTTGSLQGGCPVWSGRPFLGDYVVEVNTATGGGDPPDSGWREVASVEGNLNLSGQHLVDLDGANWIRVRGGGPNGVQVNVDVADAGSGTSGGWLFMGDSITAGYASHAPTTDAAGTTVDSIPSLVAKGSGGEVQTIGQNNGVPCSKASDALTWIDQMLDDFYGQYVTLNFGTNDGWQGQGDVDDYRKTMETLVAKVQSRGLVAVLPTIPWPNNAGRWAEHIEKMNDAIRQIYADNPDVVRGPDLYALLEDHPELFGNAGDPHPNEQGSALIRQAWAKAILENVYHQ